MWWERLDQVTFKVLLAPEIWDSKAWVLPWVEGAGEGQVVADVGAGLTLVWGGGWGGCLVCVFLILGVLPESAGVACVPPVGLVGPASVTFPVVASGEPVSVPDNLLKICKAKPVIFKGKCGGGGAVVGRLEGGTRNRPHPGGPPEISGHSRQVPAGSACLSFHPRPAPCSAPLRGVHLLVPLSFPSFTPATSLSSCRVMSVRLEVDLGLC